MLVIFDTANGNIITEETNKADIKGSLKPIEVDVPTGKEVYQIDVNNNNSPIFINKPETDLKETQIQIGKLLPQLAQNDIRHNVAIKANADNYTALKTLVDQLEADVELLKKGSVNNA